MKSSLSSSSSLQFLLSSLQFLLLLVLLIQFPDGTFGQIQSTTEDDIQNGNGNGNGSNNNIIAPTCQSLIENELFYFPNDCVKKCNDKNGDNVFDTKRSRNVNGKIKCYCINDPIPICTDEPLCSDLSIFPGTVYDNCLNNICLGNIINTDININMNTDTEEDSSTDTTTDTVVVTDEIEYAGNNPNSANKNQTHYKVSCSCDGGITKQCGIDYILFSDLTYLPSCTIYSDSTSTKNNNLNINTKDECNEYCTTTTNNAFLIGEWLIYESFPEQYSCGCVDKNNNNDNNVAIACDDTKANYNDGSGLGTKNCYESVGINTDVDCTPVDESSASAIVVKTAMTAMAFIVGGIIGGLSWSVVF
jgi:hypothetical protein